MLAAATLDRVSTSRDAPCSKRCGARIYLLALRLFVVSMRFFGHDFKNLRLSRLEYFGQGIRSSIPGH